MAIPVSNATKDAIRVVIDAHKGGPYTWCKRDCITLVEGVLAAQGIHVDFRSLEPAAADTHEETVRRAIERHGSLSACLSGHLDRVPELERADSPFEWEPGMVGLTPETGAFCVGLKQVDARAIGGAMTGVVAHTGRPMAITLQYGLLPVSALWPRWKPRMRLTVGDDHG